MSKNGLKESSKDAPIKEGRAAKKPAKSAQKKNVNKYSYGAQGKGSRPAGKKADKGGFSKDSRKAPKKGGFNKGGKAVSKDSFSKDRRESYKKSQKAAGKGKFYKDSRNQSKKAEFPKKSQSNKAGFAKDGKGGSKASAKLKKPAPMHKLSKGTKKAKPYNYKKNARGRRFDSPKKRANGNARSAAWTTLDRVLIDGAFSAIALSEVLNDLKLDERDKRLCTRIVYLTLEKLNLIDFALGVFLKEPEKLPQTLINLLRLSAAQILFLDRVPPSAVVNEAVNLTRDRGYEELTSLVNGVLRSLVHGKDEIAFPKKEDNLRAYLSICGSASLELIDALIEHFGEDIAEQIIMFSDRGFSMTVRRNMMRLNRIQFEELVKGKPWKAEKGLLPYVYRVSGTDDISKDEDYQSGLLSVQGEGSILAAIAVKADLGMNILDCCAAPGGKTMFIAEQMQGTGRVQAWDVHEKRVQLIRAASERLRLYNVRPMVRDASVFRENMVLSMDAVLLDAPCTGTGVIAAKPESKYSFSKEGLESLCKKQRELLDTVCRYVKVGGRLVYSTCSILPEENTEQIKDFLNRHAEFEMAPFPEEFPEILKNNSTLYGLQLVQGQDGMQEGFFMAAMVKTKNG